MPDKLYEMLVQSKLPSNVIYRMVEYYHFGVEEAKYDWEVDLEQYVSSLQGVFSVTLADVLSEFVARKNENTEDVRELPTFMNEAIEGIVSFGETSMSGFMCRRFPDHAAYELQRLAHDNNVEVYDVMYTDADTGDKQLVGSLRVVTDVLKGKASDCYTRGKLGTRFWWVCSDTEVRYYLFNVRGMRGKDNVAYYNKCLEKLSKHYRK